MRSIRHQNLELNKTKSIIEKELNLKDKEIKDIIKYDLNKGKYDYKKFEINTESNYVLTIYQLEKELTNF